MAAANAAQAINDSFSTTGTPVTLVTADVPIAAVNGVQLPTEVSSTYEVNGAIRYNDSIDKIELYNGSSWQTAAGGATVSSSPPSLATAGDVWYDPDEGRAYVYYNDGDSNQWVEMIADGSVTPSKLDRTYLESVADSSVTPAKLSPGGPNWTTDGNLGVGVTSVNSSSRLTLLESAGNAQTLEIKGANSGGVGSQPGINLQLPQTTSVVFLVIQTPTQ